MTLTIIVSDGTVCQNGVCYSDLALQNIPAGVHALQWDSANNSGWIEFVLGSDGTHTPNQAIVELPTWANDCVSAWQTVDNAANAPFTNEQLIARCKQQAVWLLAGTDWVELPSVTDINNPQHLLNQSDFLSYRIALRALAINPVANPTWPTPPTEQWS